MTLCSGSPVPKRTTSDYLELLIKVGFIYRFYSLPMDGLEAICIQVTRGGKTFIYYKVILTPNVAKHFGQKYGFTTIAQLARTVRGAAMGMAHAAVQLGRCT